MIRTQIQLTERQARALRQLATSEGLSMAELIRRAVDRVLAEPGDEMRRERALAAVGKFRSGRGDVARRHDEYLEENLG